VWWQKLGNSGGVWIQTCHVNRTGFLLSFVASGRLRWNEGKSRGSLVLFDADEKTEFYTNVPASGKEGRVYFGSLADGSDLDQFEVGLATVRCAAICGAPILRVRTKLGSLLLHEAVIPGHDIADEHEEAMSQQVDTAPLAYRADTNSDMSTEELSTRSSSRHKRGLRPTLELSATQCAIECSLSCTKDRE
jgi:hypothetical protein